MRITFVVASVDFGGGIRVIAQYAEGLRRRGHEVLIVSPARRPKSRMDRFRNKYFRQRNPRIASHLDKTHVDVNFLERYRPVLASDVPIADVIIATWWETAEWIADFPADRGVKVHFVQGYEIWNGSKERVDTCLRLPTEKITVSKWLRDVLVEHLECDEPKVILNGIDRDIFSVPKRQFPNLPTVGFVYSPNPIKGNDIAFAAIAKAKESLPNLRCIAFGHSQPTSAMPLPDYIEYFQSPSQNDIREIYGSCSTWLFPSREEGFGLPILEALSCGTPVVATPAGAAPDILADGGGILLDGHKPDDMADAILYLSRLPQEEWESLSDESILTSSKFTIEKSLRSFETFLKSNIKNNL